MAERNTAKHQLHLDRESTKRIHEWLHYVRGVVVGQKRRAVYQTMPAEWMNCNPYDQLDSPVVETEEMLVIEMPVRELTTMAKTQEWYQENIGGFPMEKFDKMIREKHNEEFLRDEHPGLQEAWEQYQIMLALCRTESFN